MVIVGDHVIKASVDDIIDPSNVLAHNTMTPITRSTNFCSNFFQCVSSTSSILLQAPVTRELSQDSIWPTCCDYENAEDGSQSMCKSSTYACVYHRQSYPRAVCPGQCAPSPGRIPYRTSRTTATVSKTLLRRVRPPAATAPASQNQPCVPGHVGV